MAQFERQEVVGIKGGTDNSCLIHLSLAITVILSSESSSDVLSVLYCQCPQAVWLS